MATVRKFTFSYKIPGHRKLYFHSVHALDDVEALDLAPVYIVPHNGLKAFMYGMVKPEPSHSRQEKTDD